MLQGPAAAVGIALVNTFWGLRRCRASACGPHEGQQASVICMHAPLHVFSVFCVAGTLSTLEDSTHNPHDTQLYAHADSVVEVSGYCYKCTVRDSGAQVASNAAVHAGGDRELCFCCAATGLHMPGSQRRGVHVPGEPEEAAPHHQHQQGDLGQQEAAGLSPCCQDALVLWSFHIHKS